MKTIKSIIIEHLESVGAGGLSCPDIDCGCDIKDLFPCNHCDGDCVPAAMVIVTNEDIEVGRYSLEDYSPGDKIYIPICKPISGIDGTRQTPK